MRLLDRYIMRTVSGAMLLVLVIVLSLDFVFGFIGELDGSRGDYQTWEVLQFMLLTLPRRIYDYLPLAAFMGCLIGLGSLTSSSELTVMRAAGISIRRIVWSAMKPTLVVVLVGLFIGEYVAPPLARIAESEKTMAKGASSNLVSGAGAWYKEGRTFIHLNAIQPNGVLHGVSLFQFDGNHWLAKATYAPRALYQQGFWLLEKPVTTVLSESGTRQIKRQQERWRTGLTPDVLSVLIVPPDSLALSGLFTYASYLDDQDLQSSRYWLAFWKKLLMPLATAVMVLVAISFIFGPLRTATMGFRIFTGLMVGLLFKYMQDLLGPMSLVFGFSPILAIVVPIAINALVGAILMRRAG